MSELAQIEPSLLNWEWSPRAQEIPVYDLAGLPEVVTPENVNFTYANHGHYGYVFRWKEKNEPITVKILKLRHRKLQRIVRTLFKKSPFLDEGQPRIPYFEFEPEGIQKYHELMLRQIEGHLQGHTQNPRFIDPPKMLWALNDLNKHGAYYAVGYSIPFVDGEAIRIINDAELYEQYRQLKSVGIYVGNVGAFTQSTNAIISQNGDKKFIDVRTLLPDEYVSL